MLRAHCTLALLGLAACAANSDAVDGSSNAIESGAPPVVGAGADGGTSAAPTPGLHAEYFDQYLDAKLTSIEPTLEHAWSDGSPGTGIGKDHFSARWTGTLTAPAGATYTIGTDSDDGVRVWIDDKLVIDDWHGHFEHRTKATLSLDASHPVSIKVEYFELDLDAQIRLWWSAPGVAEQTIPASAFTTTNQPTGLAGPKPPVVNPVVPTGCPDPGVLADGGQFYMVCTGGKFGVKQSRDLVSWSAVAGASILPSGKPAWAANGGRNWAPEIHKVGSSYVAYFTSVNDANILSIGTATAPAAIGPFTTSAGPLVEDPLGVIDATEFEDDDGSKYLFYKIDGNSQGKPTPIFVRKLNADGTAFAPGSTATQVIANTPSSWEGGVVEAPWVVKRNGTYFLIYSGNVYDQRYRTGAARASSITGPWTKKGAPILANNDSWVGPGHGSVVSVGNQDYFVYHAWKNKGGGAPDSDLGRVVLLDRIDWSSGWPTIGNGSPTAGEQPWPGTE